MLSGIINWQDIEQLDKRNEILLANTLDESLFLQNTYGEPIQAVISTILLKVIGDNLHHITLEGVGDITPDILARDISPYLQALQSIQQVYDEIHGEHLTMSSPSRPHIVSIHNDAPKIELLGLADAIRALYDVFTRRKRELDIENDALRNERQRLENEAIQIENDRKREEVRAMRLENDVKELLQALIPHDANMDDFTAHLPTLMTAVKAMEESSLTMRIGHHDTPRPNTLPEFE